MMTKCIAFIVLAVVACTQAGILPAAVVAPYASSYNAHSVNHAIATPFAAAPVVAAAPYVAASPYVAAPAFSPYSALPAAFSPYSGLPAAYSALPAANYVL